MLPKHIPTPPFCPDHRDKVKDKRCRECAIELLHVAINNAIDTLDPDMDRRSIVNLREHLLKKLKTLYDYYGPISGQKD